MSRATGVEQGTWLSFISVGVGVLLLILLIVAILLLPRPSEAAPCTKGVNCYCDKVAPGGPLADPQLLFCEDFEAPTLRNDQGVGQGAPFFGPWYDNTGQMAGPCDRGFNSYWQQRYSASNQSWLPGEPASPARGCTCNVPGYQSCTGNKSWDAANRWSANANAPAMAIYSAASDFSAEIASNTPPTGVSGASGPAGIFDGGAIMVHRIQQGFPNNGGIQGGRGFGSSVRTFGVTMAMAFPQNLPTSRILQGPAWKFSEWGYDPTPVPGTETGDGLLGFFLRDWGGGAAVFPLQQLILYSSTGSGGETQTGCQSKLNAATKTVGDFFCSGSGLAGDGAFYFFASNVAPTPVANRYSQATDWPFGKWGCLRGYYQNMGSTNTSIQIWFTGPSGVEKKVVDVSNMNTSAMAARPGYGRYSFDNYANANNPDGSGLNPSGTAQTTFRYEDNIHIRAGVPVSCAQIGFGSSGTSGVPASPVGVTLQ